MKTGYVINDELDQEQAEAEARFYRRLRQRLALGQNHPDYPEEPDEDPETAVVRVPEPSDVFSGSKGIKTPPANQNA